MSLDSANITPLHNEIVPDMSRERVMGFWDPSRKHLRAIRDYQRFAARHGLIAKLLKKICVLRYRFWSVVTHAEIDLQADIASGFMFPHPHGIVIHPDVTIGANTIVFQQVTLGEKFRGSGTPTVGSHVDIGAGAKILGPVTIGDYAVIGANAVVTKDVPAGALATGIPAKIKLSHRAAQSAP